MLLSLSSTCRSLVVTVILVLPEKDCVAISWLLRTPRLFLVPAAGTPDALHGGNSICFVFGLVALFTLLG